MLNSYFLNGAKGEQNLLQSLVNEQLRMYGVEVYYIPRKYITTNTVIREVIESKFDSAYPIEAYVDSYEGYGGQGTLLSKFGIEDKDDLTLIISKERYEDYITPLIKNVPNIELAERPKEGDIIFFPLGDRLFEIKFVEHEQPFYQLKKTYVYELRCELFRYEDEVLDTGVEEIDEQIEQIGHIQTLTLLGSTDVSEAAATATVCPSGSVNKIYIKDMGNAYKSQPVIGFSSAPAGGTTASGIASITYDYIGCGGEKGGKIETINLINAGCGYTVEPAISITGGGGLGAGATAGITTSGSIQFVTVTDGGSGYISPPTVTIAAPASGERATGISTLSATGIVTAVYVTYGGIGYTSAPSVTITAPAADSANAGTGSYIFNEVITGQTSGTTARVKEWDATTNKLEISIVDGSFSKGERVVGEDSGASFVISSVQEFDEVTAFADNDTIETEADAIIDFTETNPWGMP